MTFDRKRMLLATCLFCVGLFHFKLVQANESKPNVLLFLCDDMGWIDTKVYHESCKIPTPNIESLARSGIVFRDGHSASAVCTPSRYSILSGCYPFRSREYGYVIRSSYDTPIFLDERETLPQFMKRAGYHTAGFGKWHLGMHWTGKEGGIAKPGVGTSQFSTQDIDFTKPIVKGPLQLGFDYYFGLGSSINHGPYTFIENDRVTTVPTTFRKQIQKKKWGGPFREDWVADDWDDSRQGTTSGLKALAFLDRHFKKNAQTQANKPFFIYFAAPGNHWPYVPPKDFMGKPILGQGGGDVQFPLRSDMVVENDLLLGAFMDKLKDPNGDGDQADSVYENTLIVFTSDNGADVGLHPELRGKKGQIFEGGHRIPLIISYPKVMPKGKTSEALVSGVDFYATFAGLVKQDIKAGSAIDSFDVMKNLMTSDLESGRTKPLYQTLTREPGRGAALRNGKWKLIRHRKKTLLYDLENDLKEQEDLAKKQPERVANMGKMLDAILKDN